MRVNPAHRVIRRVAVPVVKTVITPILVVCGAALPLAAQVSKDTLRYADADLWRAFGSRFGTANTPALSADGHWVLYVNKGKTGDTLIAQSATSSKSWRIALGTGAPDPIVVLGGEQVLVSKPASSGPAGGLEHGLLRAGDGVLTPADWLKGVRRPFVDPTGQRIVYAVERDSVTTLYARDLRSGSTHQLIAAAGRLSELVFDTLGTQLAFLWNAARPDSRAPQKLDLYHARLTEVGPAQLLFARDAFGPDSAIATDAGFPVLAFTVDGSALRFGIGTPPPPPPPPGPPRQPSRVGLNPDSTTLELWHYLDPVLQSTRRQRGIRFGPVRNVLYDIASKRLVDIGLQRPLAVQVSRNASYALISTIDAATVDAAWKRPSRTVDVVDLTRGTRQKLATIAAGPDAKFSPGSMYVYWFDAPDWYVYDLEKRTTVNISRQLPGISWQESYPGNNNARHWHEAAWTQGDERILLAAEHDVWAVDPRAHSAPFMVTDSIGTRQNLAFRLLPGMPGWAHVTDLDTRAEGFYHIDVNRKQKPQRVVMEDVRFAPIRGRRLMKAGSADVYMVAKETASQFPDLWVGRSLTSLNRVTDLNPQQSRFRWVKTELVKWRGNDGNALQGILYKPEDFDSTKKYPMVVTYYELFSDSYHQYYTPEHFPRPLYGLNPTVYASRGYLVFVPDIVFTVGKPGESVLNSVLPGVQTVVQRGVVKENGIGCLGVSWGGWETFQLVTNSKIFAGCVVDEGGVDFASMAGYLYALDWSMQRYFENGQGRLSGSLWEYPEQYMANSPIWRLNHVTTAMVIIANDGDEVVPWWQGLAAFMGLRRLGKEAYLLNYRGETHGLASPHNYRDRDRRVHEFFDATLRGQPKPAWMREWPSP